MSRRAHRQGLRGGRWLALYIVATAVFTSHADARPQTETLRISAAASIADTGLVRALAESFSLLNPSIAIEIRAGGALTVLDDGRQGRADLVISHEPASERAFMEDGHGLARVPFAYDEYALVGPPDDPLKLRREPDLIAALKHLARSRTEFLKPADQSGNARRIDELWRMAGITPDWPGYESTGASAAATLNQAAQFGAFTVVNMGTYLAQREAVSEHIVPLYRDHPALRNTYSAIVVNPALVPGVRAPAAQEFLDYLVSDDGQALIAEYGERRFGTRLFTAIAHLDPDLKARRAAGEQDARARLWTAVILLALAWVATAGALALFARRAVRAAAAQRASDERFALAVSGTTDAVWDWNMETGEVYFSPRWKEILGYSGSADIGNRIEDWQDRIHPEDRELVLSILDDCIAGRNSHFSSQHRLRTRRGDFTWVLARGRLLRDRDGNPRRLTGSASDVTDSKLDTDSLEHQALYDPLTELPNRGLFLDRLEHARRNAERRNERLVVARLDLYGFRKRGARRDRFEADRILREAAQRIRATLRRIDTVARIGNDEFALLLPDADTARAVLPLHRILQSLERPLSINNRAVSIHAALGVAQYPDHGTDTDTLIQHAHVALYTARHEKTNYSVYVPVLAAPRPA